MAWTRKPAPPSPERVIAGLVGLCSIIGWMTSMAATAWWVIHASGPMELVGHTLSSAWQLPQRACSSCASGRRTSRCERYPSPQAM